MPSMIWPGGPQNHAFCATPSRSDESLRRRARRAPGAPVLVGVPHEAEWREPLVALVVRRLDTTDRLLLGAGEIEAGAPDHILAELLVLADLGALRLIGAHHIVEDFFPVQRDHRLEAVLRHHADGLAGGDRHPDLHRQVLRARHHGDVAELVAAVVNRRRDFEVLALEVEFFLVEAGEHELKLLLEVFPIFLCIDQRRAEAFHLARVVAAADTHDDAAVGDDVGHRVVLGEPDRVPHRQHVERAAELQAPGLGGEPEAELHQIRQAFVAFALEVMLGGPQRLVAEVVHDLGDLTRGEEDLGEARVGVAAIVGRGAVEADVVEIDLADVENVEAFDHGGDTHRVRSDGKAVGRACRVADYARL